MNEDQVRGVARRITESLLVNDSERPQNFRLDADGVNNLTRALLEVRRVPYQVLYAELKGMEFVPPDTERHDPGASHFTYNSEDRVGAARLGASQNTMPPRVDVKVNDEIPPIPFRNIDVSYAYSLQELRAATFAGRPLSKSKAVAARKAVAERHDDVILLGDGSDSYYGLRGLFKLANTLTYTIANGAVGTKRWEDKTGMEIVKDLHGICDVVHINSSKVEVVNQLGLPLSLWTIANTTRVGDGIKETALALFMEQRRALNKDFGDPIVSEKLETAGASGARRILAYRRDPEKVARVDSVEFEMLAPQIHGYETITICQARTAGVFSPYPKSVAYGDVPA